MSSRNKRKQARQNGATTAGPKAPVSTRQTAARTFSSTSLAQALVLANESKTKFDELFQSYVKRFQPQDEVEMGFINEMVAARWRQQRMWMIQTAGTDLEMYRMQEEIKKTMYECPESMRISIAFTHMANKEKTAE